ncbi:MAG: PEP/pyruvate-binding domain-containing protein [Parcubacteria group bacterium]|jgi:phosphoenolpyruvate synthase/pyruvate phosphate dikinase
MFTKNFKELDKNDVLIAGGKGASLGEMTSAFAKASADKSASNPVPSGFVVLAGAFEKFLEITDLNVEISAILDTVDTQKMHTVEKASEKIQALILGAKIPVEIEKEVEKEFKKLDAEFVAVRSSATAEDGAEAAWAGQLNSYLNTTEKDLLKNVQKCWASLFTSRAIFYRFEKELHKQKISVAVVVQKMIQSEKSGIAFSVHPVTQDYNQLIIEAGFGLGEAIVSGSVTPDSYVVDKTGIKNYELRIKNEELGIKNDELRIREAIVDINVSTQNRGLYRACHFDRTNLCTQRFGSGEISANEWRDIPEPQASSQVLNEKEIIELSDLIIKIENHYSFPCDIEWAQEGGKFYITQSRPITTLMKYVEKENLIYEKHQRDYTILIASVIAREVFGDSFERVTNYMTNPWYSLMENGIFYHFLPVVDYKGIPKAYFQKNDIDDYKRFIAKNNKKLLEAEEFFKNNQVDLTKSIKKLHNFIQELFAIIMVSVYAPEYLDDLSQETKDLCIETRKRYENIHRDGITLERELLNKIEEEKNIEKDSLEYLSGEELDAFINSGELPNNYLKRKDFFFCKYSKEGIETISQNKSGKILDEIDKTRNKKYSLDEIKGSIARVGKAKGKVRIIKLIKEAKDFQEGEILVASMTDPRYMSIMKKAGAFVTDEGGITCHAAIVARELKKPCIIGTKIATQVLHDGDLVEVDAERGVVKILERARIADSDKNSNDKKDKAKPRRIYPVA